MVESLGPVSLANKGKPLKAKLDKKRLHRQSRRLEPAWLLGLFADPIVSVPAFLMSRV
jgi:hypothetical protein